MIMISVKTNQNNNSTKIVAINMTNSRGDKTKSIQERHLQPTPLQLCMLPQYNAKYTSSTETRKRQLQINPQYNAVAETCNNVV